VELVTNLHETQNLFVVLVFSFTLFHLHFMLHLVE